MSEKKLFVGNFPWDTTEGELEDLFSSYGEVTRVVIVLHRDGPHEGKSKGIGFITMADAEEADAAMKDLHEKDFNGRPLTCNVAREREKRPERSYSRSR